MNSNQNNNTPKSNSIEEFANGLEHFAAELQKRLALRATHETASHAPSAPITLPAPRTYISDPEDEFTNVCGELLDPLSVIRVTAHISAAQPFGSIASPVDQRFMDAVTSLGIERSGALDVSGCMSLARLGAGDQTVLLPSVHGTRWIPQPGVYELELMKHAMPNVPSDVLVLQQFGKAHPQPAATPWVLRHLGLHESVELDLHRVLASLKPVHQALLVAAISRPDIEYALHTSTAPSAQHQESPGRSYVLRTGILAAMRLDECELDRDEASLVRLAAVLADLGALNLPNKPPSKLPHTASHLQEAEPRRLAHPSTVRVLGALLDRLERLEPEDALRLRALWSGEGEKEFRLGSRFGPLSKNPVNPHVARLGRALGDALGRARDAYGIQVNAVMSVQGERGHAPAGLDGVAGVDGNADPVHVIDPAPAPTHQPATAPTLVPPVDGDVISSGNVCARQRRAPQRVVLFPWSESDEELEFAQWETLGDPNDLFMQGDGANVLVVADAEADAEGDTPAGFPAAIPTDSPADDLGQAERSMALSVDRSSDRWPRPSLQWAAGMLDGDGCIAIVKQPFANRRSIFRLIVSISQNCLQTLQHFQRCVNVPSMIYAVRRQIGHNKQVYTLNFTGPNAMRLVKLLHDYLVRKRQEATVALSFCENGQISRRFGRHGVPPVVESIRVAHYKKLRALK
ncbi:hypothetical protein [Hydrogenophaga sp.]|uniref:hypothetical protein n=1 Tax=Hydrogenophaga sp. TaxID=1904254 RepID=UPI0027286CB3|nr:hypothetical protein [Hydrogenophaga sp.]MDO9436007.1 hypothetical protein [Hydrogenophaga sp.]